ncbi:MAG: hypothetical protein LBV80_08945 [Deltaproteobacteria bacterium]|jgi:TRAP-type C4-dicarboxylate transport system substrate-binding protein|nr:hypothetical protein [Deltaproteobacteria bacterium]
MGSASFCRDAVSDLIRRILCLTLSFFILLALCLFGAQQGLSAQPGQTGQSAPPEQSIKPADEGVISILMASVYPADHPVTQKVWLPWIEQIREQTGGKLQIGLVGQDDRFTRREYFDAVRDGRLGIGHMPLSAHPGDFAYAGVFGLPSYLSNSLAGSEGFWTLFAETPEIQAEFAGIKVLGVHSSAPFQLNMTRGEIHRQSDLRGKKILTIGSDSLKLLRALDANPQTMPSLAFAEVLENRSADGSFFPLIAMSNLKLVPPPSSVTLCNLRLEAFWLGMNQARYESLPPDCRAALDAGTGLAMSLAVGRALYEANLQAQRDLVASGTAVFRISDVERRRWLDAAMPQARAAWLEKMKSLGNQGEGNSGSATSGGNALRIYERSREVFDAAEAKYFSYE